MSEWSCDCCDRIFDDDVDDMERYHQNTYATGETTQCGDCVHAWWAQNGIKVRP